MFNQCSLASDKNALLSVTITFKGSRGGEGAWGAERRHGGVEREHGGAGREHGGAGREQGGAEREHRGAEREQGDEIGL